MATDDPFTSEAPERMTPVPEYAPEPARRGNLGLIIAALALLVLVIGGVGAFLMISGGGNKPSVATADAASTAPAAPATTTADGASPAAPQAASTAPATSAEPATAPSTEATAQASEAPAAAPAPQQTAEAAPAAPAKPAATGPFKPVAMGDWVLLCPEPATSGPDCLLQQELHSARTKRLVAVLAFKGDASGALRAVFQLPPSIKQDKGLVFDTGSGEPRLLPVANCSTQMCIVRAAFDGGTVQPLMTAPTLGATIVLAADDKPLVLKFSTRGLAAGVMKLLP